MFQIAWAATAHASPPSGQNTRALRLRALTASPTPMPVNAVKSGCANGLTRQRTTNVEVTASMPPGPRPSVPLYAAAR